MRISDWSSDVCSSDLRNQQHPAQSTDNHDPSPTEYRLAGYGDVLVRGIAQCSASYLAVRSEQCRKRQASQMTAECAAKCEALHPHRPPPVPYSAIGKEAGRDRVGQDV